MEKISRRRFIKTGTVAGIGLLAGCSSGSDFDMIIRNGTLIDGLGNPPEKMDLGIKKDKIAAIDDLSRADADQILDAEGLFISPGFIDIHTHTDIELLANPKAESKIRQGVTTEVAGNCGSSPFPLRQEDHQQFRKQMRKSYGVDVNWTDLKGFFQALETHKSALNYMSFTGHGDLRTFAVGKNDTAPTKEQMKIMKKRLAQTMEFGSLGLSTGLEYAPGSYAETDELVELCKVVKDYNGVYATHMRSEGARVEEAIQEALTISRKSGVSLQISHLKACNRPNWKKVDNMLKVIHQAKQQGVPVMADRYPYNAWGTGLTSFLPLWARQGNTDQILQRLDNAKSRAKIRDYCSQRGKLIGGWDHIMISSCQSEKNKRWEGKYVSECVKETGKEPCEFIFDLLKAERNRVNIIGFAMDENNLKKVLKDPMVVIGSDGSAVAPYGKLGNGVPHPRYYGSFPRVLGKYCREEKLFDWLVAIKKMTSQSARKLGLNRRGVLKKGYFADITVFDPNTVIDQAAFSDPHQYPIGIEYVIVNGKPVVVKGEHTGDLPGRILRA
ncbi:MAG TPA: D-aminoacylase [bacterium]|nr:D-aminoacylase [bacterium]